jgi:hypothetical protein
MISAALYGGSGAAYDDLRQAWADYRERVDQGAGETVLAGRMVKGAMVAVHARALAADQGLGAGS